MRFRQPIRNDLRRGFTLLELLLVTFLLLMLAGALIYNFSTLMRGNQLAEGTTRLETLMRFARAQAANSGKKVQLVFSAETNNTPAATGDVRATWEPDPLGQPGCFSEMQDGHWHVQEVNDLVQVESVKLIESKAAPPAVTSETDDELDEFADFAPSKSMSPITFYPDGSSDSAEIIVAARSPEEEQRMAVRLVGMTGSISHQLLSADVDETWGEAGVTDKFVPVRREGSSRTPGMEPSSSGVPSGSALRSSSSSSTRLSESGARTAVGDTNSVDLIE